MDREIGVTFATSCRLVPGMRCPLRDAPPMKPAAYRKGDAGLCAGSQPWFRDSYVATVPLGDQSVIMHTRPATRTRHRSKTSGAPRRPSHAPVSGARSRLGIGPAEPRVGTSRRTPHSLSTWDMVKTRRGTVRGRVLDGENSITRTQQHLRHPSIGGGWVAFELPWSVFRCARSRHENMNATVSHRAVSPA